MSRPRAATIALILLLASVPGLSSTQSSEKSTQFNTQKELRLVEGTPIQLKLAHSVSTKKAKPGDPVDLTVVASVVVEGHVVILAGTLATGHVARAKRAGWHGEGGVVDIEIDSVSDVLGGSVPLRGTLGVRGELDNTRTGLPLPGLPDPFARGGNAEVGPGVGTNAFVRATRTYDSEDLQKRTTAVGRDPGRAIVYVYRVADHDLGKSVVLLDGRDLVHLPNGRFVRVYLLPGVHSLRTLLSEIDLHAVAAGLYFVRIAKSTLMVVPNEIGAPDLYPLLPAAPKDVTDPRLR